ncbi:MAG: NAD(P)H-dependent oxidoreductase [Candidatus Thermoplasmatota archaeon]|nr:NAD(P)H-dependent oxidoreductase [Candidatus Thermoplasmatota archaeon]MEC8078711.1 NAD(P)H-dependent oxidoreductase [Candidatus Thermoplasmatota archaeon]MEE2667116.1 NAD(P)H-dependent oxidoreductase [Candidatus Thermoplasmatota archaeon]
MATIAIIAATSDRNLVLAQRFAEVLEDDGHRADVIELADMDLPIFTTSHSKEHGAPDDLDALWSRLEAADGWLVCAPEYNGSTPPTFVNAITWLSTRWQDFRALFNGRPVALATSSGGGGEYIITAMRNQFLFLGCDVVGRSTIEKKGEDARQESLEDVARRLTNLC